ncbi:J domain-containing protein [Phytoactinopolyspora mesophila]|uniref:J domain-containing protein n=1 Tax=Phytoactinopolyspora mesophila TaxID=2650750 RepID=A0A7K3MCZ7_9ACTN|nr:J domain-containing protein [Phytoactinopolyspora mesophila]NDL61134.1 hypothetical protein [Phytoactinopolyspora mesophila]
MTGGSPESGRRDPHDVLGVRYGAARPEIIRAFRRQVRQGGHPDTGGNDQTFDELVRARDVLLESAPDSWYDGGRRTARSAQDISYPTESARTRPGPVYEYPSAHPSPDEWEEKPRVRVASPQRGADSDTSLLPIVLFFFVLFIGPALLRVLAVFFASIT